MKSEYFIFGFLFNIFQSTHLYEMIYQRQHMKKHVEHID